MTTIFDKLQIKEQKNIIVLNSPPEFEPTLKAEMNHIPVKRQVEPKEKYDFALIFVQKKAEIENYVSFIQKNLIIDGKLWFAYPKMKAKKYHSDINRDSGWDMIMEQDFLPVRQIAIDSDWSALRFRQSHYIKNLIREL